MRKGRNTGGSKAAPEVVEVEAEYTGDAGAELPEEKAEGLSLRDALEVAVEGTKEPEQGEGVRASGDSSKDSPSGSSTKEGEAANASGEGSSNERSSEPALQPPAEYTAEEKADFLSLSRKGQEAQLRLHRSRLSMLEEIKREKADNQWVRDVVKEITPFLKVRGEKEPTHAQVIKALKVVNDLDTDAQGALLRIAKAKNIPVPKEWEQKEGGADPLQEKIAPLQSELNQLKSRIAQEDLARARTNLSAAWQAFETQTNAAGQARFPDLSNPQTGLALASKIGSLVSGQTELSKQFIADVKGSNPNCTYNDLLEAAYRYYRGRVDDSEASRSQDTQKHIERSSRAAASVPGRGGVSASASGGVKKFKSYRDAAKAALAELTSE